MVILKIKNVLMSAFRESMNKSSGLKREEDIGLQKIRIVISATERH